MLDGSPAAWAQKSVYFVSNLLGIALALYKCSSMGLLPTHSSDWLSFLEPQQVSCNFDVRFFEDVSIVEYLSTGCQTRIQTKLSIS